MHASRATAIVLAFTLSIVISACGEPPEKEMQQALGAIDAAQAAGAAEYAAEEFRGAQDALKKANEAASQRDFRLALNYALDSRERAQTAAKQAADAKAVARVEADRALSAAESTLNAARQALKTTDARAAKSAAAVKTALSDGEQRVQEARAAFDRGEYRTAVDHATSARQTVDAAVATLAASRPPGTMKRHR